MSQQFLVTVQRMCVDEDDNSIVVGWSAVIDEENLLKIDLTLAAAATKESLKGAPLQGLRSMTLEEVNDWRRADD